MKKGFTLTESLIVIIIIGIVYVVIASVIKPSSIKKDVLVKGGANLLYQIDFATKQILLKNSNNYTMTRLKEKSGAEFDITSSGADAKLSTLYRKNLVGFRKKTVSSTYKSLAITTESGAQVSNYKVSTFTQGFFLKNKAYFALKLNGNCTTTENYIYNPQSPDKRTATKSCGLIFFDVNGESDPNKAGIDMYIISIGKNGVK